MHALNLSPNSAAIPLPTGCASLKALPNSAAGEGAQIVSKPMIFLGFFAVERENFGPQNDFFPASREM
jgi:hypothetical protein